MIEKQYIKGQGRQLFHDTWKYGTQTQKEALLKARDLDKSWAKTKTPDEMVKRGGGMVARDLGGVFDKYLEKHPTRKIKWR